jgi:predicted transcriptional regulator of viral defense system
MRGRRRREGNRLVNGLVEQGRRFFRVEDAMDVSGKSANTTVKLVERLTEAGQVVRVERGLYMLAPEEGETLHPLAIGRELAGGARYYIGYGSAMEVHGMLDEPAKVVTVVLKETPDKESFAAPYRECSAPPYRRRCAKRLRRRTVLGNEYVFLPDPEGKRKIVNPKPKPAQWMVMEMEVAPGETIWVSDPEWTILSSLGRPEMCGGVGVIAAVMDGWREKLDLEKLVRYTHYMRNLTAARRLGYLLERLGMLTERTQMKLSLQVRTSYGRLEPGRPWKGELERKWRVDVND